MRYADNVPKCARLLFKDVSWFAKSKPIFGTRNDQQRYKLGLTMLYLTSQTHFWYSQ
jgi:hypothetical protein